jgi:hypothetical protein
MSASNEPVADQIIRHVTLDASRTILQVLENTCLLVLVDDGITDSMPPPRDGEVDVVFFRTNVVVDDPKFADEYARHGLIPADPFSVAAVNEVDPTFATRHRNGTLWRNADGQLCYLKFSGKGRVNLRRYKFHRDWTTNLWVAGIKP